MNSFGLKKILGKISLVILLAVGIFCLSPLYASVTETISLTATQKLVASFSFEVGTFKSRKSVYPDRVSFDTTGYVATTTPVPSYVSDYVIWEDGFPVNDWQRNINNKKSTGMYYLYSRISQFPQDFASANLRNKYLISIVKMSPIEISYGISDTINGLIDCENGIVTSNCSNKSFAAIVSRTKAYCCWNQFDEEKSKTNLRIKYFNGSSWSSENIINNSETTNIYGVSGCLVKENEAEYIAIAYPTASKTISIVSFSDSSPNSYNITTGITVNNDIIGAEVAITQNPRNGNIYLCWISGGKAYYKIGNFSPNASTKFVFSSEEIEICSVTDSNGNTAAISAGSFNNFETSFTICDDNGIRNYCVCGSHFVAQTLPGSESIGKPKYSTSFQYYENGNYYFGAFCCSKFYYFDFYSRLLEYPTDCAWKADTKVLHIEGPPRQNTKVLAQVDFAEMATSDTYARCVNSEYVGGVRSFTKDFVVDQGKAIIASSSACFFAIGFDKAMNQSLYQSELASAVKLTETLSGSNVPITYVASSSGKLVFKPNSDLKLNTSYRVDIASSVIDAVGSQIYKNEYLTFSTQPISSELDASGVIRLEIFTDSAYTTPLTSNSDIKSNQKLYLRLNAYDPAFNTIDTTTITVKKSGTRVATLSMTQKTASSNYFYCEYQMSAPENADSNWIFETVNPAIYVPLKVTYPILTPSSPASGSIGLEPSSINKIEIEANEALNSSSVNTTNVKLYQLYSEIPCSVSYDSTGKKIVITPLSSLNAEKNYLVVVNNISDVAGNKQLATLAYYFTTRDNTAPTVTNSFPANGASSITIDSIPYITFSEEILKSSASNSTVKMTCNGSNAAYSLQIDRNQIKIIPTGGLRTESSYKIDITTGISDFSGNHLASQYSYSFTTQASHSKPKSITSLSLYRDSTLFDAFNSGEKIKADSKVFLKLNAVDGATQTLDVATISLQLNSVEKKQFLLYETASNSGGLFTGSYDLSTLGLYSFSSVVPSTNQYNVEMKSTQDTGVKAELKICFPSVSGSLVETTSGQISAIGASGVYVYSPIILNFSDELASDSISATSITISSGATILSATRSISSDLKSLTIIPDNPLPFASKITVTAPYSSNGLKDITGNPIDGPVNFNFTTQTRSTTPTSISAMSLYSDSSMSAVSKYSDNQDFNKTSIIYIEEIGVDAAPNTIDTTTVTVTGGEKVVLTETDASSGIFRGSYQCSGLSDGAFKVTSDVNIGISRTLILTTPVMVTHAPLDGAVGVSNAQAISISYSEPMQPDCISSDSIKVKRFDTSTEVDCSYSISESGNEIIIRPQNLLDFEKKYVVSVGELSDLAGNKSSANSFSFTVQDSAVEPDEITSLSVYADSGYIVELASGSVVAPGFNIAIKVVAVDKSPTTVDFVTICMEEFANGESKTINLIETSPSSGVFKGTADIFLCENAYVALFVTADTSVKTGLITDVYPKYVTFTPASGTSELYLDAQIKVKANKDIDTSTLSKSSVILESLNSSLDYNVSCSSSDELLISILQAQPGETLHLTLTGSLHDAKNLAFPLITAYFKTKDLSVSSLKLYSDAIFSRQIASKSDIEPNQSIYCEVIGSDLTQTGLTDTLELSYCDTLSTQTILLTEVSAGKYRGSFNAPDSPGKELTIIPAGFASKAVKLNILEPFVLTDYYPASGAISIPSDSWPTWNFNRKLSSTQLTSSNFSVYDVTNSRTLNGTLSLSPSGMQVRFQPASVLGILTTYEMRLSSAVTDVKGMSLGVGLKTRFTTQPPPLPPNELKDFANYVDDSYVTSATAVLPGSNMYLQMRAKDTSFSTYESARIRMDSSDGTYDGRVITLIETNPPSGIFRLVVPVEVPAGTKITLTPQVDADFAITVTVKPQPTLVSVEPASGTKDLYLDADLIMTFSTPLDKNGFIESVKLCDNKGKVASYSSVFSNDDNTVTITPIENLKENTTYTVSSNNLKNINGQPIKPFLYKISTRKMASATFELYTGLAPCEGRKVSETGEIVYGLLGIVASTSDLLEKSLEERVIRFEDASHTVDVNLYETAMNSSVFVASITVDADFSSPIKAKLLSGGEPQMEFSIATATTLVSVSPSENEENVSENTDITAVFSRKIYCKSAEDALKIGSDNEDIPASLLTTEADSKNLQWKPVKSINQGNRHSLNITGLIDYLGQSVPNHSHIFYTGGEQGICIYSDSLFTKEIVTKEVSEPAIYIEIIASGSAGLAGKKQYVELTRGTKATETVRLEVSKVEGANSVYRCALKLAAVKSSGLPTHSVGLYPGEWVKLASPLLTSRDIIFYYRYSSETEPSTIHDIKLYSDKKYMRSVGDEINNPSVYVLVKADDLNWLTQDITKVKVTSDDDKTGIIVSLLEDGTHSSDFRGMFTISEKESNAALKTIKVAYMHRLTISSVTDPNVKVSLRYHPKAEIINFTAFPNPVRKNYVKFRFFLNFPTEIQISIYDSSGDRVDKFYFDGREGENIVRWDLPRHLANGVYIYRVKSEATGDFYTAAKKVKGKFAVLR